MLDYHLKWKTRDKDDLLECKKEALLMKIGDYSFWTNNESRYSNLIGAFLVLYALYVLHSAGNQASQHASGIPT